MEFKNLYGDKMGLKLTPGVAEFVGVLIGDGYVYIKNHHYVIGIVGSPKTDLEYFDYLKKLILQEFAISVKIKYRYRGLRIVFGSKEVVGFLCKDLGMIFGKNKSENVFIPNVILKDKKLIKSTIRGIADTDGSIFVAKKPGILKYPSIEITTSSYSLALQLRKVLTGLDFRVANIWNYKSKFSKRTTYKLPLNGRENIKKWVNKIGFSNPYKLKRAIEVIK